MPHGILAELWRMRVPSGRRLPHSATSLASPGRCTVTLMPLFSVLNHLPPPSTSLHHVLPTHFFSILFSLMSVMAPNSQAQQVILESIATLTNRIDTAISIRDARAQELRSLQSRSLPMLTPGRIPDLAIHATQAQDLPIAGPSSGPGDVPSTQSSTSSQSAGPPQKRPRTSAEDLDELSEDVRDDNLVASNMLVDSQSVVSPHHPTWRFLQELAHTHLISCFSLSAFTALKAPIQDFLAFLFPIRILHLPDLYFLSFLSSLSSMRFILPSRVSIRIFPSLYFVFLFFFLSCSILPSVQAMPPVNPVSLRTISINANGLADPMKIAAIRNMVQTSKPHSFVIGETKNSEPISSRLGLDDYQLFENPGRPLNTRGKGKWGVIVGIQRGLSHPSPQQLITSTKPYKNLWQTALPCLICRLSHLRQDNLLTSSMSHSPVL